MSEMSTGSFEQSSVTARSLGPVVKQTVTPVQNLTESRRDVRSIYTSPKIMDETLVCINPKPRQLQWTDHVLATETTVVSVHLLPSLTR